jgi:hypothetical protein
VVFSSCASVLRESGFSSANLPSVSAGGGLYRLRPPSGGEIVSRCAFEGSGETAIAWTLFVTKSEGWAQDPWYHADVDPVWGASLGKALPAEWSATPGLSSEYKLPRGVPTAVEETELGGQGHVLLTHPSDRLSAELARVSRPLDRERTWDFRDISARRRLDPLHAAGTGSSPLYLVFSRHGGICLTRHEGSDGEFDCGAGGGVQDLLGLLDTQASAAFGNCDAHGWKANERDTLPEVYLADSCYAPDNSFSARCTMGGACLNPTCCKDMFQSDQIKCGTRRCQPYCSRLTAQVDACASSVDWIFSGGWTSVWFGTSRSV